MRYIFCELELGPWTRALQSPRIDYAGHRWVPPHLTSNNPEVEVIWADDEKSIPLEVTDYCGCKALVLSVQPIGGSEDEHATI